MAREVDVMDQHDSGPRRTGPMTLGPAPLGTTVAGVLHRAAWRHPAGIAVVSPEGRAMTYHELVDGATRLGHGLLGQGLTSGDRVAAWMEDSLDYIQLYAACALAGLVMVPINARLTVHEASHPLTDSGARLLVATDGLLDAARTLAHDAGVTLIAASDATDLTTLADLMQSGSTTPHPMPSPADLYMIGYTSGTTGRAKGAELTQGSVSTLAHMNALSYRLPIGSVCALTGSMSFVAVVPSHIISHFVMGGTLLMLRKWDVTQLVDLIARERVTFTYIPSPLLTDFAEAADPRRHDLQSLTSLLHSGSKASVTALRRVADVIGDRLIEGWGMTENSGGLVTATVPGDVHPQRDGRDRLATVGRAVAQCLVEIVDESGAICAHDGETVGELVVSSPSLLRGYWRQPEATRAALRDGWYHSGDMGTIDPEGYISIHDRRVDLIVSGGMNVYPAEVEEVILAMPGVRHCAVVGTPDARWGQAVTAVVVPERGASVTSDDVIHRCRELLASFKKPTRVLFVEALPMTTSLKVSRAAVRQMVADRLEQADAPPVS